jgi:hypothetical protein
VVNPDPTDKLKITIWRVARAPRPEPCRIGVGAAGGQWEWPQEPPSAPLRAAWPAEARVKLRIPRSVTIWRAITFGSGVGASGGAAAGAALGAVGGPPGMIAGAAVGARVGGAAGMGVARAVNPARKTATGAGACGCALLPVRAHLRRLRAGIPVGLSMAGRATAAHSTIRRSPVQRMESRQGSIALDVERGEARRREPPGIGSSGLFRETRITTGSETIAHRLRALAAPRRPGSISTSPISERGMRLVKSAAAEGLRDGVAR